MSTLTVQAAATNPAAAALARQEDIIARGLTSFLEVGDALQTIRSERLYLLSHATFADYCLQRWGFSDARARQLVLAAKTVTVVTAGGLDAPTSERQARELAKVPEPQREQVWRETLDRTDGKPTAAAVREAATAAAEPTPAPLVGHGPGPVAEQEATFRRRRQQVIRDARRTAERIVSSWRVDAVAIVAGIELGEPDLITAEMVAELRAVVAVLEDQLRARVDDVHDRR
jgi:hypothetical protein